MDTAQHTPGPWIVKPIFYHKSKHIQIYEIRTKEDILALVYPHLIKSEHNARLIAAAPDLLATLETAIAQFDLVVRALALGQAVSLSSLQNCAASARATIEKARGL